MRTAPLLRLAVCLSSMAPLVSAWPGWLPGVDTLIVRADDNDTKDTAETGATATATSAAATKTATDDGDLNTAQPTKSSTKTATDDDDDDNKKTKSAKSTSVSIPATAQAGGVSITNPATTVEATPLFKIGDNITLGWNYTGLVQTPTAVDVLISCSTASETWTLTSNMTFETDVSYTWNSNDQAENLETPLLTELYTLIIKNSDAEVSDTSEAGKLAADAQFTFGMYYGQSYTPYADWTCNGCSAASALFDPHVLQLALTMSVITFVTFTCFVTGWGIH